MYFSTFTVGAKVVAVRRFNGDITLRLDVILNQRSAGDLLKFFFCQFSKFLIQSFNFLFDGFQLFNGFHSDTLLSNIYTSVYDKDKQVSTKNFSPEFFGRIRAA